MTSCATLPKADRDLLAAVEANNPGEVDRALAAGARLDVHGDQYCDGLPPLGCAARWGLVETAEALIAHGADVNGRGRSGIAPLNAATRHLQPAVADLLIRHGADVNVRRQDGETPLHNALETLLSVPPIETPRPADVATTKSLVQLLLASGAQVDARSDGGITPIHVAAATGQRTLVQWLIDRGADVNTRGANGVTPLHWAAQRNAVAVAQLLIARGAAVDARTQEGYTPLKAAAGEGNPAVAKLLIEHGADVQARDNEGRTPLLWACNVLLVRYSLQAMTPAAEDQRHKMSTLESVRARGALSKVKGEFSDVAVVLLEHGADANVGSGEHRPMRTAAIVGDMALVDALMAHGGRVNPDPENGLESPLHAAIAESHDDVAARLIDKGADVNALTSRGRTPLHFAVYMHDRRLVELLIQHGADVNARDTEKHTPLAFALKAGRPDLADLLRQHGAHE